MTNPVTEVATAEKTGMGSVYEFTLDDGTTWLALRGLNVIPQLGDESELKDIADISEDAPRYMEVYSEGDEVELSMTVREFDANQQSYVGAVRDRREIQCRITYATGSVATFKKQAKADYMAEATKQDDAQFVSKSIIVGSVAWAKVA